jgi:cysteine desulfurase
MKIPIYLDNNATTPLDEEVLQVMTQEALLPLNPSSSHSYGNHAKLLLKEARLTLSKHLGISPEELLFTSGGTESMNFLIKGLYPRQGTILTTSIEHPSVHETILDLEKKGASVSYVPVGAWGAPTIDFIKSHLNPNISLMVFSAVYSETGVKIDLPALAHLALIHRIPLVIDGVALLGKELFSIPKGVKGMGFSAHKLHGPKGIGAAFLSCEASLISPLMRGGHQELGMRPGTEPLDAIRGFAKAVALAEKALPEATEHMAYLQRHFEDSLKKALPHVTINGEGPRVCNISNLVFHEIDGETLLLALDRLGIYASLGSACSSGAIEPSRVLLNMGLSRKQAKSSLRFSFSRKTTLEDINEAVASILSCVQKQLAFCSS